MIAVHDVWLFIVLVVLKFRFLTRFIKLFGAPWNFVLTRKTYRAGAIALIVVYLGNGAKMVCRRKNYQMKNTDGSNRNRKSLNHSTDFRKEKLPKHSSVPCTLVYQYVRVGIILSLSYVSQIVYCSCVWLNRVCACDFFFFFDTNS